MASLLCDLHFWTSREDIQPRDTDQSTFKYYDKTQHKSTLERTFGQVRAKLKIILFLNSLYLLFIVG
jgi:hypothetical protein